MIKAGNQGKRLTKKAKQTKLPLSLFLLIVSVIAIGSVVILFQSAHKATTNLGATIPLDKPSTANTKQDKQVVPTAVTKMKIPSPVFVTGLPKSGTTSIWKYFLCGLGAGQAAHQWAQVDNGKGEKEQVRLGKCLKQNVKHDKPLLEGCGDYLVWTDMGIIAPGTCFYPSVHGGLEALYKDYPQATLLSVVRDIESWVNSTTEFNNLWDRWIDNKCDKFPGKGSTHEDFAKFYDWHTEMVRQFAKDHPSMTYIEVTLEGNDTGQILEEKTGINASCWVHSKTKKGRRAKPQWQKRREQESKQTTQQSEK